MGFLGKNYLELLYIVLVSARQLRYFNLHILALNI